LFDSSEAAMSGADLDGSDLDDADHDDSDLGERARTLLASGKLPSGEPSSTWAGSGRGEVCCLCRVLVRRDEIGFDLAFRAPADEIELHMHARCRIVWEQARSRILS
jgi:hypothetical protein